VPGMCKAGILLFYSIQEMNLAVAVEAVELWRDFSTACRYVRWC
jgi:hypothetical protein